ncbi:MAG: DUF835 domain-containing protein [Candidatus Eremiobacteraeota bacterium]|nr:DUF835 domain-containing protein [Candidatus Eremiobacteraeota bacterium]
MIVEDNPDHLSFEKESLEQIKDISHLVSAGSSKEAREKMEAQNFDMIILDYKLPDSDGLSFLESLTEHNNDIPVVMVTGLGNEKIAVRAMKLGIYDYIVKDRYYLKNLPKVIKRSLEKLKLSRSLKLMGKQLRESEERYQKLFENANSGFVSIDMKTGKFINPNKRTLELTGYSREELEKITFYDIADSTDRENLKKYYKAIMKEYGETERPPFEYEFWIATKNNDNKYLSCTVSIFPQIGEVFITLIDITDRKELEEQLKIANEKLKQYTKELEDKVDDLRKRLDIEPTLENLLDTEQKYNLDFGVCYLLKEEKPNKSFDIFKDFVSHGTFGLCITRTHPARIQKLFNLKKTPMVWLSKTDEGESSISGSNLGALVHTINQFIEKSGKSIVILDGLEYLITINGFDRTILYLYDLIESIMISESILILPIHVRALERKELSILERTTETIDAIVE